MFLRTTDTAN